MSYRNLEIWDMVRKIAIEIHRMSLSELPKFELYEMGSQIRRSSKGVKSAIVEGYGRRRYPRDFVKFLVYAQASNDETIDHLETLWETNSLQNEELYQLLHGQIDSLGKKLNRFIQAVERRSS